ncbi:MAG: dienelactone hydrolase family protein, partial [Chrysiogenetes bacterium]|nr:dienelactone hydrolase family protein [Chrysiogenetes bacterium]
WLTPARELTRRVPPAEYSERLREIAQLSANMTAKPVPLDICQTDPSYGEEAVSVLSALSLPRFAPLEDARPETIEHCPFYLPTKSDDASPRPLYFADKCHPNVLGARLVAYQLACHIWGKEHPMTERTFSLEHTLRRPDERSEGKPPVLIALHGIGSNDKDLIGLQPFLDPRLYVIAARAPHEYAFPGGYSWFDLGIDQRTGEVSVDIKQIEESRDKIIAFIDEVIAAYDVDPKRVYLMGFSQGSMMSYTVLAKAPEKIAGIVAMSGRFVPELFEELDTSRIKDFPILVTHGTLDDVLPIENGRAARDALEKLPVNLTYKEYPMAHEVSQASIGDVSAWLKEQLGN